MYMLFLGVRKNISICDQDFDGYGIDGFKTVLTIRRSMGSDQGNGSDSIPLKFPIRIRYKC